MDDREIETWLRRALAVEPSPDFLARVRIGLEHAPRAPVGLRARWIFAVAAAAIVVAVGAALVRPQIPQISQIHHPVLPASSITKALVAHVSPARAVSPPVRAGVARVERPAAETVLVPRGQEAALGRFVTLVNEGRIDTSSILITQAELAPVALIETTIVPITIEPLFPVSDGETPPVKEE